MSDGWRTYGPPGVPGWIDELDCPNRVKNVLKRDVTRLSTLVRTGVYFHDAGPIPEAQLADFRHDLDLWGQPEQVLLLLERYPETAGPKTAREAVAAIRRYLSDSP